MKRALWVFRKEAREMFRDRRVVVGAFVMPVFMIIMFVQLIGMVEDKVSKPKKQPIAVIGTSLDETTTKLLDKVAGKLTFVKDKAEGVKLMQKGTVKLVVDFGPGIVEELKGGQAKVVATYDSTDPISQIAVGTLRETVEVVNKESVKALLKETGMPAKSAEPIKFEAKGIEKPKGLGGSSMVGMLPYLIVIWAFYGGFSIVSDLVAGEKERGTMETLLVSPARRREIAFGKYLSLVLVCLLSSVMSIVAIFGVGALHLGDTKLLFPTGMSISGGAVAAMLLAIAPLVLFFAGILLSVSAAAKNMREAQTYLTLVSFVVIMPAV